MNHHIKVYLVVNVHLNDCVCVCVCGWEMGSVSLWDLCSVLMMPFLLLDVFGYFPKPYFSFDVTMSNIRWYALARKSERACVCECLLEIFQANVNPVNKWAISEDDGLWLRCQERRRGCVCCFPSENWCVCVCVCTVAAPCDSVCRTVCVCVHMVDG